MRYVLIGILATGLVLRLLGVRFGLPLDVMGDEFVHIYTAFTLMDDMTLRALSPQSYVPSLFGVLLIPFTLLFAAVGIVVGLFEGVAGFKEFVILNATDFISLGRVISAFFGVACIYLMYRIVVRLMGKWPALFAAALMALDFWFMHESNKAHFWVPATTLLMFAMYTLIELTQTGWLKWYVGFVTSTALGVWMGFFPVILAPFFLLAHFHTHTKRWSYLLYTSGMLAIAVAVIAWLNPLSILKQFGRAIRSTLDVVGIDVFPQFVGPSDTATDPVQNLFFLLHTLFWDNPFVFVIGVVGLGCLVYRQGWRSFAPQLFGGFFVTYLLVAIFIWPHPDHRYILPLIVPLIVGTAYSAYLAYEILHSRVWFRIVAAGTLVLTVGYSLYVTGLYGVLLLKPDTRIMAREWIFAHVPDRERIFTSAQYFMLPKSKEAIEFYSKAFPQALRTIDRTAITLPADKFPKPAYFVIDTEYAPKIGREGARFNYLVTGFTEPGERIEPPQGFERIASFYPSDPSEIIDDLLLGPHAIYRAVGAITHLGPHVEIYKRVE